jgi:PAS domain S-box-containing protein
MLPSKFREGRRGYPRNSPIASIFRTIAAFFLRSRSDLRLRMESGRLYRVLVETAPDAVFLFDREGTVCFANSRAAALLGYACREELIGRRLEAFVRGSDLDALRSRLAQASDGDIALDLMVFRRDGTRIPVESTSSFVEDEGVRLRHALVVWRDVSRRCEGEDRIRVLSEKLKLIIRIARHTVSLNERGSFAELVVDSTLALCPGSLSSLWRAEALGEEKRLLCIGGVAAGIFAAEGSAALEVFRSGLPVFRRGTPATFAVAIRGGQEMLGALELTASDSKIFDESSREALVFSPNS